LTFLHDPHARRRLQVAVSRLLKNPRFLGSSY
jgi:hypothetical protein